jgi:hypothetical protein
MAKYQGRVKLNKPFRTPSASKKFGVYVKDNRSGQVTGSSIWCQGNEYQEEHTSKAKIIYGKI